MRNQDFDGESVQTISNTQKINELGIQEISKLVDK